MAVDEEKEGNSVTIYRVIKPYTSQKNVPLVTLPVGTLVRWWEERGFYLSEAVDNVCVPLDKWAVESWHDYFEKVEEMKSWD